MSRRHTTDTASSLTKERRSSVYSTKSKKMTNHSNDGIFDKLTYMLDIKYILILMKSLISLVAYIALKTGISRDLPLEY